MWCAECGNEMARRDDGAWHACCNRLGYWSDAGPLGRDLWWFIAEQQGKYFYPTDKWPVGHKPAAPVS